MKASLKRFCLFIKYLFPHKLPTQNEEQVYQYIQMICDVYGIKNELSTQYAVAQSMMQLPPLTTYKSPHFFIKGIQRQMTNEAAFLVLQDVKKKSHEQAQAEEDAKKAHLSVVEPGSN